MDNRINQVNTPALLNFSLETANVTLDALIDSFNMKMRQTYLNQHKYKIWLGSDEMYYTLLPDENAKKKRRVIRRTSKEALENAIIDHYMELDGVPTFKACFESWAAQKLSLGEIKNGTFDRYHSEFKRFIEWHPIAYKKICDITTHELEEFIRLTIAKQSLTAKAYSNMRTLIIGSFKYAKKLNYSMISISTFFGDLDLSKKSFKKPLKGLQVFSEDELPLIVDWLKNHPSVENLGVVLVFQTGMREAELSAIKFSDYCGNKLHVHSQEIKYKSPETGKLIHEFVEYTKTDAGDRYIYLSPSAVETIQKIKELNPDNDYMMMVGTRKIYTNTFNDRLYKACDACGIPRRSMHKIRKTYGTILLDSDLEDSFVMEQMGHSDIATTRKYYYYSNKNEAHKSEQIAKAIPF